MRLRAARVIIRGTGPIRATNTTFALQVAHKTGQALKCRELLNLDELFSLAAESVCARVDW